MSSWDLPSQTTLKFRGTGQNSEAELRKRDVRAHVEESERRALDEKPATIGRRYGEFVYYMVHLAYRINACTKLQLLRVRVRVRPETPSSCSPTPTAWEEASGVLAPCPGCRLAGCAVPGYDSYSFFVFCKIISNTSAVTSTS